MASPQKGSWRQPAQGKCSVPCLIWSRPWLRKITALLQGAFGERNARGRADAVVKTPAYIYIFEFKLNGTAEEALQQIDDKGYLIPYQADGRKLIKIGVEFSATERNISRWLP